MITVEIKDLGANNCLSVELKDILRALPAKARQLSWAILDLEAVGDLGPGTTMLDLERKVREAPLGLKLTWRELLELSARLFQTINATIVAIPPRSTYPSPTDLNEIRRLSEMIIEMIDSSVWVIRARDDRVIDNIFSAFHDAKLVK